MLYESGESVEKEIMGHKIKEKTYVWVDDCFNSNINNSFQKMIDFVQKDNVIISTDSINHTIVTKNNKLITLCKERIFNKETGEVIEKTSDILRHIITRDYTKDTLFKDENGEVKDLTRNAMRDITGRYLNNQHNDFKDIYINNPELYIKFLFNSYINGEYLISKSLNDILQRYIPITIIKNPKELLKDIIDKNYLNHFDNWVRKFKALNDYIKDVMNIKYVFSFGEPDLKKHEQLIKDFISKELKTNPPLNRRRPGINGENLLLNNEDLIEEVPIRREPRTFNDIVEQAFQVVTNIPPITTVNEQTDNDEDRIIEENED